MQVRYKKIRSKCVNFLQANRYLTSPNDRLLSLITEPIVQSKIPYMYLHHVNT